MYQLHLYATDHFGSPVSRVDSYTVDTKEEAVKQLEELFNIYPGISKIVIENDEFEDSDGTIEPQPTDGDEINELVATKLALDMYDTFASELVKSLTNIKNINEALSTPPTFKDGNESNYFKGKADAYKEIVERIGKEYTLAKQGLTYDGTKIFEVIGRQKNLAVDRIIPENRIRGRREYGKMYRIKGNIADLLERFAINGFLLGVKYYNTTNNKSDAIKQFIKGTSYDERQHGNINPEDL
jgi:hypothetical protein